jgi:hypothetical protein
MKQPASIHNATSELCHAAAARKLKALPSISNSREGSFPQQSSSANTHFKVIPSSPFKIEAEQLPPYTLTHGGPFASSQEQALTRVRTMSNFDISPG